MNKKNVKEKILTAFVIFIAIGALIYAIWQMFVCLPYRFDPSKKITEVPALCVQK